MTFGEIFPQFLEGKEITKKDWEAGHFIHLDKKLKCIKNQKGYAITLGKDLIENVWEIWTNRQYFDFNKAFELMEKGKGVRRNGWGDDFRGWIFIEHNMFKRIWENSSGVFYYCNPEDYKAKDWYLVGED